MSLNTNNKNSTKPLIHLEVIRTLAILLIVIFHTLQTHIVMSNQGYPDLFLFFSASLRFALALFFIVSGFLLGRQNRQIDKWKFIWNKLLRIGVPLILWGVIYLFIWHDFDFKVILTWPNLIKVLTGTGPPFHLGFLFIMLQILILYPFVYRLPIRRLWLVALALQALFFLGSEISLAVVGDDNNFYEWTLGVIFPAWSAFFVLGLALGRSTGLQEIFASNKRMLLIVAVCSLVPTIIHFRAEVQTFGHPVRYYFLITCLFYQYAMALLVFFCLRWTAEHLNPASVAGRIQLMMASVGRYTYGVYLNHFLFVIFMDGLLQTYAPFVSDGLRLVLMLVMVYPLSLGLRLLFELPGLNRVRLILFGG